MDPNPPNLESDTGLDEDTLDADRERDKDKLKDELKIEMNRIKVAQNLVAMSDIHLLFSTWLTLHELEQREMIVPIEQDWDELKKGVSGKTLKFAFNTDGRGDIQELVDQSVLRLMEVVRAVEMVRSLNTILGGAFDKVASIFEKRFGDEFDATEGCTCDVCEAKREAKTGDSSVEEKPDVPEEKA